MESTCDCSDLETALKFALETLRFYKHVLEDNAIEPSGGAWHCERKLDTFLEEKGWHF